MDIQARPSRGEHKSYELASVWRGFSLDFWQGWFWKINLREVSLQSQTHRQTPR